jgi:hypothetical protein
VDRALAGRLAALGDRGVADEARRLADRIDPAAALRRCKRAVAARRVSIRPAPGGMSSVTGSLPVAHGVAAYAALRKHAVGLRTQGDPRSVGQIMADEFFSRLTGDIGSSTDSGTRSPDVEVGLVMSERSLLRGGTDPAVLTGPDGDCFGHVPAMLARRLVRAADRVWLRRLYAAPTSGELVAMDSRRRTFSGGLRALLVWRDRTCRMPWCEAPVRHVDHVLARSRGGPTRSDNGEGLCEACNYVKEEPGWRADVVDLAGVVFTTPSGHRYPSRPPPAPGHDRVDGEERLRRSRDDWIDGLGA